MKPYITATDVANFKRCAYRPYMDLHGDPAERSEIHPLIELLWDAGVQYEAKVIDRFRRDHPGKTFIEIGPNEPASEKLFEETRKAMLEGADYIYQGVLIHGDRLGRPDLLVKAPGPSSLGDYHYEPLDIKLAAVEENEDDGRERPKPEHLWQLYFYAELLAPLQGLHPARGVIFKTLARQLETRLDKVPYNYDKALTAIRAFREGSSHGHEPALGSKCGQCPWEKPCKRWVTERQDPTLLYWVGASLKYGLRQLGIHSVTDLAQSDGVKLKEKVPELISQGFLWKSFPPEVMVEVVRRARVYLSGEPKFYTQPNFPDADIELHYDIEDDPTQDFVYLHGVLVCERGREPVYHSFFADTFAQEKEMAERFFEFLSTFPGAPVYVYSSKEASSLKRLLRKHKLVQYESLFEEVFGDGGRAIDLFKWIDENSDWPLSSYGLKAVCKHLGFRWRADDAGGANSVVWMNEYLAGQIDRKAKILTYNEDDVRATAFLKGWLSAHHH